jgi:hypothetical protein
MYQGLLFTGTGTHFPSLGCHSSTKPIISFRTNIFFTVKLPLVSTPIETFYQIYVNISLWIDLNTVF